MKTNDFGNQKPYAFCCLGSMFCVPPPGSSDFCAGPRRILASLRGPLPDIRFDQLFYVPSATKVPIKISNRRPEERKITSWDEEKEGRTPAWQVS